MDHRIAESECWKIVDVLRQFVPDRWPRSGLVLEFGSGVPFEELHVDIPLYFYTLFTDHVSEALERFGDDVARLEEELRGRAEAVNNLVAEFLGDTWFRVYAGVAEDGRVRVGYQIDWDKFLDYLYRLCTCSVGSEECRGLERLEERYRYIASCKYTIAPPRKPMDTLAGPSREVEKIAQEVLEVARGRIEEAKGQVEIALGMLFGNAEYYEEILGEWARYIYANVVAPLSRHLQRLLERLEVIARILEHPILVYTMLRVLLEDILQAYADLALLNNTLGVLHDTYLEANITGDRMAKALGLVQGLRLSFLETVSRFTRRIKEYPDGLKLGVDGSPVEQVLEGARDYVKAVLGFDPGKLDPEKVNLAHMVMWLLSKTMRSPTFRKCINSIDIGEADDVEATKYLYMLALGRPVNVDLEKLALTYKHLLCFYSKNIPYIKIQRSFLEDVLRLSKAVPKDLLSLLSRKYGDYNSFVHSIYMLQEMVPYTSVTEYVVEAGEIAATMHIVEEIAQNIVLDAVWAMHLLEDLINAA